MPNRHNSRPSANRSPSGGRGPGVSRPARTVQVSRAPGTPSYTEPEMRRWPHPPEDSSPAPAPEPAMHYIRCALSYQNQLLAGIKALLEQMAADRAAEVGNPEEHMDKL